MSRFSVRPAISSSKVGRDNVANGMIVAALVVLFLYLGREILQPLVIAALLGFILAPLIRRLRRFGVWRVPSVILVVLLTITLIGALGSTIVLQLTQLADDLPKYETNLRTKIRALGSGALASGALERAAGTLKHLQSEIGKPVPSTIPGQKPMVVEVREQESGGLGSIASVVQPLLSPLGTTALTILFLLFILLQQQDLHDRVLRLAGTADLQRTTAALDDAGARLSRFFLMQTLLNVGFGIFIAIGLAVIGVPSSILWGILAGLMRFVPFVGSVIAAFFPVALAAAVDPGSSMVLATIALFLVAEPVSGQIIEPLLFGKNTGLSPVAIVVSTLFWALLWGPIGLLLATPLTVCLVVLGRHIDALEFINVILGDEPALELEERCYQRLLVNDATEVSDQAEQLLKEQSLSSYYDRVPMRALGLAQVDAAMGSLPREKQSAIREAITELVENLSDYGDDKPGDLRSETDERPSGPAANHVLQLPASDRPVVLCVGSRSPIDDAASDMLSQLLDKHGLVGVVQPFADVSSGKSPKIDAADAPVVCLSYFGAASNPAHVRYLIRRLKRRMLPSTKYVAGFWMLNDNPEKAEDWRIAVGAHFVATTLAEAVGICVRESQPTAAEPKGVLNLEPNVSAPLETEQRKPSAHAVARGRIEAAALLASSVTKA